MTPLPTPRDSCIATDSCMRARGAMASPRCAKCGSKPARFCRRSTWGLNSSAKGSLLSETRCSSSRGSQAWVSSMTSKTSACCGKSRTPEKAGALRSEFFGEGLTIVGDQVFQLTWKSGVGFVYDVKDFRLLRKVSYSGEGWGLATNGRELFLSDGTAQIRILDPETFQEKRRLKVHDGPTAVDQLNELEFVEGQVFANVWHTNRIARISPQTGEIVGWIDLSGLLSSVYRLQPEAV